MRHRNSTTPRSELGGSGTVAPGSELCLAPLGRRDAGACLEGGRTRLGLSTSAPGSGCYAVSNPLHARAPHLVRCLFSSAVGNCRSVLLLGIQLAGVGLVPAQRAISIGAVQPSPKHRRHTHPTRHGQHPTYERPFARLAFRSNFLRGWATFFGENNESPEYATLPR